ncbi:hypothetical protein GS425_00060 [Rhodococcus hoagii]|nr:hypothetical protein [Prescottella equi]
MLSKSLLGREKGVVVEDRAELMAMADSFDQFVADAIDVKYQGTPEPFVDMMRIRSGTSASSLMRCCAGGYPPERLEGAVIRAFDLKLQFTTSSRWTWHLQPGYSAALDANGLTYETATPNLLLTRLSLDQNLIGKMRILWERLMNLVYFVETGKEIPAKARRGSSSRGSTMTLHISGRGWVGSRGRSSRMTIGSVLRNSTRTRLCARRYTNAGWTPTN